MLCMRVTQVYCHRVQLHLELPPPAELEPTVSDARSTVWQGTGHWQIDGDWAAPRRLGPDPQVGEKLARSAGCGVGVRAELSTDAATISLPIQRVDTEGRMPVDLVVDDELAERVELADEDRLSLALPGRPARVELWLPHTGNCRIGPLTLTQATFAEPVAARPQWAAYGSSITQCSAADGPSSTWPALVARRLGWDLRCFGFNGQAHLEPAVASAMAAGRPRIASVCAGINIYNQASMTGPQIADRLREFVTLLRGGGDPAPPVAVMSPIVSPDREQQDNAHGMTLDDVRRTVAKAAADLGSPAITGTEIFGSADVELLSDGLHPTATGYRLMADRLTPILAELLA